MSLSKPLMNVLGLYFEQLYNHPVRTKCISSCLIATLGNLTSQYLAGNKVINQDSLIAFGLFGFLFGGTVPHFFYLGLDQLIPRTVARAQFKQLLVERLLFTPLYQALSLYMLARLEGKSHKLAVANLMQIYMPILKANWKWLTLLQFINLQFVPPMLRALVMNLIGFFWVIFLANKRRPVKQGKKA